MSTPDPIPTRRESEEPKLIEVRTYFVRNRNALLARAQFSEVYLDYYLHLMQAEISELPGDDNLVKDLIAAFTLHMASKPILETPAWTIHFEKEGLDLFATGSNLDQRIIAHASRENVTKLGDNLFASQIIREKEGLRESRVPFIGKDIFTIVEDYYNQSEQRPARYFQYGTEEFVMVSAQPNCDRDWFNQLDTEEIKSIDQTEELSLLEKRYYKFECGCSNQILAGVLSKMNKDQIDDMFAGEKQIIAHCPRCGMKHALHRNDL